VSFMNKNPLWFNVIAIIVIVIAVASFISDAPFLRILNTLGLFVLMVSFGTIERRKNKARAFTLFGISAFLVFVLVFQFLLLYKIS